VYRQLRLAVVLAERERLLDARRRGAYPSRILAQAQGMLDLEETRLRPRSADH
jgi:CPA1 family monovalent cation:H+ antiporter